MKKTLFFFALLFSMSSLFGGVVITSKQSDCLGPIDSTKMDVVEHEVIGCTLFIYHNNVVTNCCLKYEPKTEVDGSLITVVEVDTGPPCDCICPFNLEISIEGLEPGTYDVSMKAFNHSEEVHFKVTIPPCNDFLISGSEVWASFGTLDVEVPVFATNSKPIQAFSFGTIFPCKTAQMTDINIDGTITKEVGAEFINKNINNGETADDTFDCGWATFAVILDIEEPFERQTIPPGDQQHIATIVYDILMPSGSVPRSMSVPFKSGIGKPPVDLVYTVDGQDVTPEKRSGIIQLTWPPEFIRGDANDDSNISISDPVYLLNFLFAEGPVPPCEDAADANDNGSLDLADAISILQYLFMGGEIPKPSPPGPPGIDPTPDTLGCRD